MKTFPLFLLALLAAFFPATAQLPPMGWELAWSDEFNYRGLPDPSKWGYEEGFVRNKENQFYTRARQENARVEGGILVIECRKEAFTSSKGETAEYTSASLTTEGKTSWKYGRIEVRAKLPFAKGVWPAIWTLGIDKPTVSWPACGEIDIMEFYGRNPEFIFGTVHYGPHHTKKVSSGGKLKLDKPHADFHIYAVEWRPDRLDFFVDKTKYHSFSVSEAGDKDINPFQKAHFLLINFAIGGTSGGSIDDSAFPLKYLVDYVRVYRPRR